MGFAGATFHGAKPDSYKPIVSNCPTLHPLQRPSTNTDAAHWSRFIVKQTFSNIQPKRSFTRHQSIYTSNVNKSSRSLSIHTSDTAPYGWQWYEMWFFTYWSSPDSMTLMCLDVPTEMQLSLEQMFSIQEVIRDTPYSVFQIVTDELLRAYDRSIWSIRDHISQWEVVSIRSRSWQLY